MQAAMSAQDSLLVLPTGGGKSLCYQVPAVCLPGAAMIVSPLISLMKDQVDAAVACGIPAAFLNSSQSGYERTDVLSQLRSGKIKLLYVAPERATLGGFLDELTGIQLSFIAVDEAHCVSTWGHDFRPPYRELWQIRERFPKLSMHAFTATATPRVRKDIIQQLQLREPPVFVGNFDRPNLNYRAERRADLAAQLLDVVERHPGESGIIYCITRKEVEQWAEYLQSKGIQARPYHAGLDDAVRKQHQEQFLNDEIDIIVATVAFGMGIDKPTVRFVAHTGMPPTVENYQQESGRAGRDGLEAECVLFFGGEDFSKWDFLQKDQPDELRRVSRQSLQIMANYCQGVTCRHRILVQHFGQDLDSDCGSACDICLGKYEVVPDALVTAQKILSCVYRLEQRFGVDYTALVLKGSRDKRILSNGHDRLSTYGLLGNEPKQLIMDWIGQLVQQGCLQRVGEYNLLQLTSTGGELLRGKREVCLLRSIASQEPQSFATEEDKPSSKPESWEGVDRDLFEHLRQVRQELARERGVPPYVIFSDASLRDMCRRRPSKAESFLLVTGVGQKKNADFGARFLHEISVWCLLHGHQQDVEPVRSGLDSAPAAPKPPSRNAHDAFPLFRQGLSVEEVALRLDRAASTAHKYLCDYIMEDAIADATPWVSAELVAEIEAAIDAIGPGPMKPIYLRLGEKIAYESIRIVSLCRQNREAAGN